MASLGFNLRSDLHVARKLWHGLAVLFLIICHHNLQRQEALFAAGIAAILFISFDLLRLKVKSVNHFAVSLLGGIMRKHELHALAGTTYLLAGVFFLILLFPYPIVKLALFFLAIGDPIASYFGLRFGKDRLIGKKTLQGTMATFAVCLLISIIYFLSFNLSFERLIIASTLAGLIGALSELIPIGKLDDNFTFPLLSAIFLFGLFKLFGL